MRNKSLGVVAALAISLSLAGCSGGEDDKKPESASSSDSSATKSVDKKKTSPDNLKEVPALKKGYEGAVKDVEFGECPTENGKVEVTAEVTNSTDESQDYVLVISWINGSNDVLGRAVGKVEALGAEQSEELTLSTTLDAPTKVTCTYNVTRGSLKS